MTMKINDAILAGPDGVPPIDPGIYYQYVVAENGLFIRAEDTRLAASIKIASCVCHGSGPFVEFAGLKVDRVPGVWLRSVLASARRRMPDEAMYQFHYSGDQTRAVTRTWRCSSPAQIATPTGLRFDDDGDAVIDLHSHNSMPAFFSATDDADEQGLRFYAVIGRIDTDQPQIRVRVGVYGHFLDVPADMIFDDLGPFADRLGEEDFVERTCRVCGSPMRRAVRMAASGCRMIYAAIAATF
jgi:PRTRC genetic system protein A